MKVTHDLFKLTTADGNVPDSPFEGGEGVVSVPDRPVLSVKGAPPGSQGYRPPLLRGIFRRGHLMILLIGSSFLFSSLSAAETRFKVKHDHGIRSCQGELVFGDTSVKYETSHKNDARVWKYEDIQQLGLLSPKKISLLTYEDRKLEFGKDKIFNFELTEGVIPEPLRGFLQGKLTKPLVSELIPADIKAKYEIPVKHQHAFGGCQGTLEIGEHYIAYKTRDQAHSRLWRYEDLSSMGSTGPFQLRLTTFERTGGENNSEKNYIFNLKRRLDQKTYDFIWWKLNGPQIASGLNHRLE